MHTIGIRPAQCIAPPPSPAPELLQVQPLAAQAASACKLPPCKIIIKIYIQFASGPALPKECVLGLHRMQLRMLKLLLGIAHPYGP